MNTKVFSTIVIFLFTYSFLVEAKPPIKSKKILKVKYASAPWNTDPTKIDSAYIFVRSKKTSRIVKILLEETAPDSSQFSGRFSVGWDGQKQFQPEVFIPPKKIRGNKKAETDYIKKIRSNKVGRMPLVFKTSNKGQSLEVFDTKGQAKRSYDAYLEFKKVEAQKNPLIDKKTSPSALEAAILAKKQAQLKKLAAEALSREQSRIRQEQMERQRIQARLKKQQQLDAAEKRRRKAEARRLSEKALQTYRQGNFPEAEKLFKKSIELAPSDKSYYFRYGVTLYRNEKFNEALVIFKVAEVDANTDIEKRYYMGLIHMKLKEIDPALTQFRYVKSKNHAIMSPSAAFYEGLILFNKEEYELAKAPFEFVLDNSKDPRLDEKAEDYLEKIANAMIFKRRQKNQHDLSVTGGLIWDSNVLFSPDNETSSGSASATQKEGGRLLTLADYSWRFMYERTHDFSLDVDFLYIWSLDDKHKSADPTLLTTTLPYNWKGVWGKKGYKLSLEPGYEILLMDADNSGGNRESILSSIILNTDLTLIMSDRWFASYAIEARIDDSSTTSSIGDNDADATKIDINTSQTFFIDKAKKTAFIADFGFVTNQAKGKERVYNRIDLAATYTKPFEEWKGASWNTKLSLFQLDYPDSSDKRSDFNTTLAGGVSKTQSELWSWGVTADYAVNSSNVEANDYSKYTVMTTVTFNVDDWWRK